MGINTKESLGLHTISDGPDAGKYSRAGTANMVIKAPPVGTPHFTNWDAGLTSLEKTTKERFETRTATKLLDQYMASLGTERKLRCGAQDIKIVDNIAAISYPKYTDIRKITATGGVKVLTKHSGIKENSYDYNCITWTNDLGEGIVLIPQFYLNGILSNTHIKDQYPDYNQRWTSVDLSGLYLILTYDGNYTKNDPDPCVAPIVANDGPTNNKQLLKYKEGSYTELNVGEYTIAYINDPYKDEDVIMLAANIGHNLDVGPTEYFTLTNPSLATGFGYISCTVEAVKYLPIVECGKVDLFVKKTGSISSYQSQGKLVSVQHNLQNGDIIKIYDAINSDINGVRYVQVVNDSTFIIYSDSDFTQRVNSYYEGSPVWSAYGNIYNEESQSWDYLGSLIGSNNYDIQPAISTLNLSLGEQFNNAQTMDDIFKLDFGLTDAEFATFMEYPLFRTAEEDALFASLDLTSTDQTSVAIKRDGTTGGWTSPDRHLWTSPFSYLTSFEFGCSIDLVKHNGRYVLAVGQKGLECIQSFYGMHLPKNPVYGCVFLYDIITNATGKPIPLQDPASSISSPNNNPVQVRNDSVVYAHTGDSEIATPYKARPEGVNISWLSEDRFSKPSDVYTTDFDFGSGLTNPIGIGKLGTDTYFLDDCSLMDHSLIEYGTGLDYWYGSMVYNFNPLIEFSELRGYKIYNDNNCRNAYFTNLKIPEFLEFDSSYYDLPPVWTLRTGIGYDIYPYVDNFGKAVALVSNGSNLTLCTSSKTKPIVERINSGIPSVSAGLEGQTCTNTNLNKTHCGYVHIFNIQDGTGSYITSKTQKIYESQASTLPSGKYYGFYYKAQKFASYIIAQDDELIFGQTKPIDYHTTSNANVEKSKIFIYKKNGSQYVKINEIENTSHNNFNFLNRARHQDQKEYFLRDGAFNFVRDGSFYLGGALVDSEDDRYDKYYYPPDRFGSWFRYNGDILVTNAFDIYNEDGEYHGSNNNVYDDRSNEFNRPTDYLHVYEKHGDTWNFVVKIAPAFDQYDASYSYTDVLGPNFYHSIRSLGNKNYSNTTFNSKTWDIDLTGCYDLINDRILMKDPLSYSVFQKDVDYNTTTFQNNFTLDKYFTYDEKYQAESGLSPTCQLIFDRVSAIHKYDNYLDDFKNLYCQNNLSATVPSLNYRSPVYFINIPINSENITRFNSITIKLEEIRSLNAGVNLKLILFKKDPRTTVYPFYQSICSPTVSDDANEKWRSSLGYTNQTFLRGGTFDSVSWTDGSAGDNWSSCEGDSCMAKFINASSILISGARRDYTFVIDNNQVDINDYITTNNLILNSSHNRTFNRSGIPSETIEFNDIANIGYDASINVEASIIVGFIYQPMSYKINSNFNARADVRIVDITFDGFSNMPPSPTSNVEYTYQCKFNKVANFDYIRQYYNSPADKTTNADYYTGVDGKILYTSPIIKAGIIKTSPAAYNDDRTGVIDGVFSKSYEVLSVDNFGTEADYLNVFSNTRSLDLQYLETIPFYINAVDSIPYINLFMKTSEDISSNLNLFLNNTGSSGNFVLYTQSSLPTSGNQDFRIFGANISSGTYSQFIAGGPVQTFPLFLKVPDLANNNANLYIDAYGVANSDIGLYMDTNTYSTLPIYLKSRDPIEDTQGFTNIVHGALTDSSFYSDNLSLFIDVFDDARTSLDGNSPLYIIGPDTYIQSGINSMPLYIGQIVRNSSGDFSLFNFGGFGGNFTSSGGYVDLFINNTGINSSGSVPLSIPNRGFNNSIVVADNTSLFLKQTESSGNINLFMDSSIRSTGTFDLYLKTGVGVLSSGNTTFIRGYRS